MKYLFSCKIPHVGPLDLYKNHTNFIVFFTGTYYIYDKSYINLIASRGNNYDNNDNNVGTRYSGGKLSKLLENNDKKFYNIEFNPNIDTRSGRIIAFYFDTLVVKELLNEL